MPEILIKSGVPHVVKNDGILIKSGKPYLEGDSTEEMLELMHKLNPINGRRREDHRLCSGQTLICASLGLKVKDWNKMQLDPEQLYVMDVGY